MSRSFWLGAIAGALALNLVYACTGSPDTPRQCIPPNAVDYQAGAWFDSEGRAVLVAPEEDSYEWCE